MLGVALRFDPAAAAQRQGAPDRREQDGDANRADDCCSAGEDLAPIDAAAPTATLGPMEDEGPTEEDIETRALRRQQAERAETEHAEAGAAPTDEAAEAHERRAEKAEYLKQKLEERAEAEREAAGED